MNNEPLVIRGEKVRAVNPAAEIAKLKKYSDEKFADAQRAEQKFLENAPDGTVSEFFMQVCDMVAGLCRRKRVR